MAQNYKELGRPYQKEYKTGVALVDEFVSSLEEQGLLPKRFAEAETKPVIRAPEAKLEKKRFSKDELILPEESMPQEVLDLMQRAEKAGIGVFEPYHLSGVTLSKDSKVDGWNKKPNDWYWEQVQNGNIGKDAPKLPGAWVLIDKTQKPDYKDGKQLYEDDPLGIIIAKFRREGKIERIKGIPEASRFGISPDELTTVVLPKIAKVLGVETSAVRLPKAIEFNLIGNIKHPEWGTTNTWEWFNDNFEDDDRLIGGHSGNGGLAHVRCLWPGLHDVGIAFRPLVVVSPKA